MVKFLDRNGAPTQALAPGLLCRKAAAVTATSQGNRVGSAKDGKVISFIEETQYLGSFEATGAANAGNVYAGYTGAQRFGRFPK